MSNGFDIGWGSGAWGSSPWGGAFAGALELEGVVAARENVIQLEFSRPIYFSQILDVHDGSQPELYTVNVVPGTRGLDDSPVRPVTVVATEEPIVPGFIPGQLIDLILDRPMTAYPASYTITVSPFLVTSDLGTPISGVLTLQFLGVHKEIVQPTIETPLPRRDIANPQTLAAMVQTGAQTVPILGTITVDATGDYAFDEGIISFKKRLFRRLMTTKGAFLHLPNYGVGLPSYGKKLATAAVRAKILADTESQISREPEVQKVRADAMTDPRGLFKLSLFVKLRSGKSVVYDVAIKM